MRDMTKEFRISAEEMKRILRFDVILGKNLAVIGISGGIIMIGMFGYTKYIGV